MFFQISPVRKSVNKVPKPNINNESEEITELSLAPFTGNPKLSFENVTVKSISSRKLLVKNPHNYDVQLNISHNIPDDMSVSLNWHTHEIKANTEAMLEIVWSPQCDGTWRFSLTIEGSRRIQKVVPIAFKSVSSKVKKKSNTKPSKVRYPSRRISPAKKSPLQKVKTSTTVYAAPSTVKNNAPIIKISTPNNSRHRSANKENVSNTPETPVFVSPSKASFHFEMTKTVERRDTYTLRTNYKPSNILASSTLHNITTETNKGVQNSFVDCNREYVSDCSFNDSLEMPSASNLGEKLQHDQTEYINTPVFSSNLLNRLQSDSFTISPLSMPKQPVHHPNLNIVNNPDTPLQYPDNTTRNISPHLDDLNRNFTYEMEQCASKPFNLSTETYVKGNISSETYTKADISGGTYIKDNSLTDLTTLSVSPSSKYLSDNHCRSNQESNYHFFLERNRYSPVPERNHRLASPSGRDPYINTNLTRGVENNLSNFPSYKLGSIVEESFSKTENANIKKSLKRPSTNSFSGVSPKRPNIETPRQSKLKNTSWAKKPVPVKTSNKTSGLNLQHISKSNDDKDKETMITVTNTHHVTINNPFILAATTMIDPFMTLGIYVDQAWVEEQEINFKKWLNALLTPPEELDSNIEGPAVNVSKLWQQCKNKDVAEAPTKEAISHNYHTNARLTSLRKAARALYMSGEISNVLSKVVLTIETEKLMIRKDRNVHLDLGLQAETMSFLLSYNPLWLRIGLETIYNQQIPLHSNSDVMGLSTFIMNRFFRDPHLLKKHKSIHAPKYVHDLKKHILKKYFILVYFLDQAKAKKLIAHDPCLFCKNAPIKESREMLIRFARDTISSIGDITKYLKLFGYVVTHKQTFINEFDYAVKNLGADLRDGVRLTRVMEIILLEEGLTNKLRVPAISRLQKVHNTKLAFDALEKAGYQILQDITPKDLVDGHREKTLSFLWQIIYKLEAPLMVKSVTTIQKWWRSLGVSLKRNKLRRTRMHRENAAEKIQRWYRNQKMARKLNYVREWVMIYMYNRKREIAVTKIQSYFRMYIHRKKYLSIKSTTIRIQAHVRRWLFNNHYKQRIYAAIKIQSFIRMVLARNQFIKYKHATLTIQNHYIAYKLMKAEQNRYKSLKYTVLYVENMYIANQLMKHERNIYLSKRHAAITIQRKYRATKLMQQELESYTTIKCAILTIQVWYRSVKSMQDCRTHYRKLKQSVLNIEEKYLAKRQMQQELQRFKIIKKSVVIIQNRYRAHREMKHQHNYFLRLKTAAIIIQQRYRAKKAFEAQRYSYLELRKYVTICQNRFRANRAMKMMQTNYQNLRKASIIIQQRYRAHTEMKQHRDYFLRLKNAAHIIQQRYRAKEAFKTQRYSYLKLRKYVTICQNRFRANCAMKIMQTNYQNLRKASIIIQQRYRAQTEMKRQRNYFLRLKNAAIIIQQRYRAKKAFETQRYSYLELRKYVIICQNRFRANCAMKIVHTNYQKLRTAAMTIQIRYKAKQLMKRECKKFQLMKISAVTIQRFYRSWILMRAHRDSYCKLKETTIRIQELFRAKLSMRQAKANFVKTKSAATIIQRYYRAHRLMINQHKQFMALKNTAIYIQHRYRAKLKMKHHQRRFTQLKTAAIVIQQRFRAIILMKKEQQYFNSLRNAVTTVQMRYRAKLSMKYEMSSYMKLRNSSIVLQRRFRARCLMRTALSRYKILKSTVVRMQTLYRAKVQMKLEKAAYTQLKHAALTIQQKFRANRLKKLHMNNFKTLRNAAITIQRRFRAQRLMRIHRHQYLSIKHSAITLQQHYRAKVQMVLNKTAYNKLKTATIIIQRRYRATLAMRADMSHYKNLKNATIVIQQRYRAQHLKAVTYSEYQTLKHTVLRIQRMFRAKLQMRQMKASYDKLKCSTLVIQRRFRASRQMKIERYNYTKLRSATVTIQRMFVAKKLMEADFKYYQTLKTYVLKIQLRYRAKLQTRHEMNAYNKLRYYTIAVQRRFRANKLMKKQRMYYILLSRATLTIQSRLRLTLLAKRQAEMYRKLKSATIFIQRKYRSKRLMQLERGRYLLIKKSVSTLQQKFEAFIMRKRAMLYYQKLKAAAVFIQRRYRANLLMKKTHSNYLVLKQATLKIQQLFRARKQMRQDVEAYQKLRHYTIKIQQRFRSKQIMLKDRNTFKLYKHSVLVIEQRFIEYKNTIRIRREFNNMKCAAIKIQNCYRNYMSMKTQRQMFLTLKRNTIVLQQRYRAQIVMRQQRIQYLLMRKSVVSIQRYFRNYLLMKQEHTRFLKTRNVVCNIQPYLRGYLIRKKYTVLLSAEARQQRKEERFKNKAATKIQALWRGHRSRSLEDPKLVNIRQRTKEACSKAVPEDTLGHRCGQAVQLLITENITLLQILKVLQDLEYITRRCRNSCQQLSKAFPEQLYVIISSTSRSLPEMNACDLATNILINLCKYHKTTSDSWVPEYIDNVITVMLNWCDKESLLFSSLCTLLWLFAHNEEYKSVIKSVPNYQKRMAKIESMCMRKHKMVNRTGIKGLSVFGPYSHLQLPSLKPDWGLDLKNQPKTFTNSVHALQNLLLLLR